MFLGALHRRVPAKLHPSVRLSLFQIFDYEDNTQPSFHDESDTDDDESSMQGDYGESSEDEVQVPAKVPNNDLEWDHSNLGF